MGVALTEWTVIGVIVQPDMKDSTVKQVKSVVGSRQIIVIFKAKQALDFIRDVIISRPRVKFSKKFNFLTTPSLGLVQDHLRLKTFEEPTT